MTARLNLRQAVACLAVHTAPLNPGCEKDPNPSATCQWRIAPEPSGWKSDLKADNTLLCKLTVTGL